MAVAREAFKVKPMSVFNLLPLISLIPGQRPRVIFDLALSGVGRADVGIHDLWMPLCCVATNDSQSCVPLVSHVGSGRAVHESSLGLGTVPLVTVHGEPLGDGGNFKKFWVDVRRSPCGLGQAIEADLNLRHARKLEIFEVLSGRNLLSGRHSRCGRGRYRSPGLSTCLPNVKILFGSSRRHAAVHVPAVMSTSTPCWSESARPRRSVLTPSPSGAMPTHARFSPVPMSTPC